MTQNHVTPNECSNCHREVPRRRPSKSGKHWCQRPTCQAAKQRHYYASRATRQAAKSAAEELEQLKLALVAAIVGERYLTDGCPECGRSDPIEGWVHPNAAWNGKCLGTGYIGDVPEMMPYFVVVWPKGAPEL